MGRNRSVLGLAGTLLAAAVVPAALLGAGVGSAAAAVCGSLNRQNGALASGDELSGVSYVSPSESWAVGNIGVAQKPNQTLTEQFNGSTWSVVPSPNVGTGTTPSTAFP